MMRTTEMQTPGATAATKDPVQVARCDAPSKLRPSTWLALSVMTLFAPHAQGHNTETHARIAAASFVVLDESAPQDGAFYPDWARTCFDHDEPACIPLATMNEDRLLAGPSPVAAPFVRHFFNPQTGLGLPGYVSAAERAGNFWNDAVAEYCGGTHAAAFENLGHALHLLQDMTSPAHVHSDPHVGQAPCVDNDDFENWGWCESPVLPLFRTFHIKDYVDINDDFSIARFEPALRVGLEKIFDFQPVAVGKRSSEPNVGYAYVRKLAEQTYDFTTFQVTLRDTTSRSPDPGEGELKRMFPSLTESGLLLNAWSIDEVGSSQGTCTSQSGEWWVMEAGCTTSDCGRGCDVVKGQAYIENSGGADPNDIPDTIKPQEYDRPWFVRRYGSKSNSRGMMRIYGDVLYPAAVAYGAGMMQAFLDEVEPRLLADPGGPYEAEACTPVGFAATADVDRSTCNPFPSAVKLYEWDFDDDGVFDSAGTEAEAVHTYPDGYDGVAVLRVTNRRGRITEERADVRIRPDQTPPVIEALEAMPERLWPPLGQMIPVDLTVSLSDTCGADCHVVSVMSSEPSDARGIRNPPDWEIAGDLEVILRAETSRGERTYAIDVECVDEAGNSSIGSVDVSVSSDRGRGGRLTDRLRRWRR